MLTLKCTLMNLNDDGLWLARLLRNERYATIRGADVRVDKFSEIPLRSLLTHGQRTRKFTAMGALRKIPLTPEEETRLAQEYQMLGEWADDWGHFSFSPIVEMYNQGNSCAHCHYARCWGMDKTELELLGLPHGLNFSRPRGDMNFASQINDMGTFAKWWIAFGGFEPIAPREGYDRDTQLMLDALFGRPARQAAIDSEIFKQSPAIRSYCEN